MVFFYDLEVGGEPPADGLGAWAAMRDMGVPLVPDMWMDSLSDWLGGMTLRDKSNGLTRLACPNAGTCLREGVVIRPATEQWSSGFGRIIIKQRSPEYLVRSDS